jgi:hypothetical protein
VTDRSDQPEQPGGARDAREARQPRQSGSLLPDELQRWLLRSGARSMRRELTGQVRRTFGGNRADGDVWAAATAEPPLVSAEAPECAWCPICRAARRIRESGSSLGGLTGAGDAVSAAVEDALAAFDAVLSMHPAPRPETGAGSAGSPPRAARDEGGEGQRRGPDDRR